LRCFHPVWPFSGDGKNGQSLLKPKSSKRGDKFDMEKMTVEKPKKQNPFSARLTWEGVLKKKFKRR